MKLKELKNTKQINMADEIMKQRAIEKNRLYESKFFYNSIRIGSETIKVKTWFCSNSMTM